jgi:TP901 family phage tail tape measure protein
MDDILKVAIGVELDGNIEKDIQTQLNDLKNLKINIKTNVDGLKDITDYAKGINALYSATQKYQKLMEQGIDVTSFKKAVKEEQQAIDDMIKAQKDLISQYGESKKAVTGRSKDSIAERKYYTELIQASKDRIKQIKDEQSAVENAMVRMSEISQVNAEKNKEAMRQQMEDTAKLTEQAIQSHMKLQQVQKKSVNGQDVSETKTYGNNLGQKTSVKTDNLTGATTVIDTDSIKATEKAMKDLELTTESYRLKLERLKGIGLPDTDAKAFLKDMERLDLTADDYGKKLLQMADRFKSLQQSAKSFQNVSNFKNSMNDMASSFEEKGLLPQRSIDAFKSQFQSLNAESKNYETTMQRISDLADKLNAKQKAYTNKNNAQSDLRVGLQDLRDLDKLDSTKLDAFGFRINAISVNSKTLDADIKKLKDELKSLNSEAGNLFKLDDVMAKFTRDLNGIKRSNTNGLDADINSVIQKFSQLNEESATFVHDVKEAQRAMQSLKDSQKYMVQDGNKGRDLSENNAFKGIDPHNLDSVNRALEAYYGTGQEAEKVTTRLTQAFENGQPIIRFATSVRNGEESLRTFRGVLNQTDGSIRQTQESFQHLADSDKHAFWANTLNAMKKVPVWMGAMSLFYGSIHGLESGIQTIADIDGALTDLRKVTDLNTQELQAFKEQATAIGATLGQTTSDVIKATTSFAQLGYTIQQSTQLGKASLEYSMVGNLDIQSASNGIIGAIKGFNMQLDNQGQTTQKIVDIFNEVSNNFAISSAGIGQAFERSSASLYQAGNSVEQATALVTAANSTIQNPERVGTALKTVAERLRGIDDAGNTVAGLAPTLESTFSKIGISITKVGEDGQKQFQSTYDIFKQLSEVWGNLTDFQQADIISKMGGKEQATVVSSIIQNWSDAQNAYNTALNSTGSAQREIDAGMDSIAFKVGTFKNAVEEFWTSAIDQKDVKAFIDLGTQLVIALTKIVNVVGLIPPAMGVLTATFIAFSKTARNLAFGTGGALLTYFQTKLPSALRNASAEMEAFNQVQTTLASRSAVLSRQSWGTGTLMARQNQIPASVPNFVVTRNQETGTRTVTNATRGLSTAERELANANLVAGESATTASLGIRAMGVAMNFVKGLGFGAVITLVTIIVQKAIEAFEKAKMAHQQMITSMSEDVQKYNADMQKLQPVTGDNFATYNTLQEAQKDGTMTVDQRKQLVEMQQALAEVNPQFIKYYNDQGEAVSATTAEIQKYIEKQNEANDSKLLTLVKDKVKGYQDELSSFKQTVEAMDTAEALQSSKKSLKKINNTDDPAEKLKLQKQLATRLDRNQGQIDPKISNLDWVKQYSTMSEKAIEETIQVQNGYIEKGSKEAETKIDEYKVKYKQAYTDMITAITDGNNMDDTAKKNTQVFIQDMVNGYMDANSHQMITDGDKFKKEIEKIIKDTNKLVKEGKLKPEDLIDTSKPLDTNALKKMKNTLDKTLGKSDPNMVKGLNTAIDEIIASRTGDTSAIDGENQALDEQNGLVQTQIDLYSDLLGYTQQDVTNTWSAYNAYKVLTMAQQQQGANWDKNSKAGLELTKVTEDLNNAFPQLIYNGDTRNAQIVKEIQFKDILAQATQKLQDGQLNAEQAMTYANAVGVQSRIDNLKKEIVAESQMVVMYNKMMVDVYNKAQAGKLKASDMSPEEAERHRDTATTHMQSNVDDYTSMVKQLDGLTSDLSSSFKIGDATQKQSQKINHATLDLTQLSYKYQQAIAGLNLALKENENLQKKYPEYSKQYRDALAQEISLLNQKKALNDAEVSRLKSLNATSIAQQSLNSQLDGSGGDYSGSVKAGSSQNASYVWDYFKSKGLSDYAVAGILGNLMQESSLNPTVNKDGIAQWNGSRRTAMYNYANQRGMSWTSLDAQLGYLWQEISSGNQGITVGQLNGAGSASQASQMFSNQFERPGNPMMSNRVGYANSYYNKYNGTGGSVSGSGSGGGYSGGLTPTTLDVQQVQGQINSQVNSLQLDTLDAQATIDDLIIKQVEAQIAPTIKKYNDLSNSLTPIQYKEDQVDPTSASYRTDIQSEINIMNQQKAYKQQEMEFYLTQYKNNTKLNEAQKDQLMQDYDKAKGDLYTLMSQIEDKQKAKVGSQLDAIYNGMDTVYKRLTDTYSNLDHQLSDVDEKDTKTVLDLNKAKLTSLADQKEQAEENVKYLTAQQSSLVGYSDLLAKNKSQIDQWTSSLKDANNAIDDQKKAVNDLVGQMADDIVSSYKDAMQQELDAVTGGMDKELSALQKQHDDKMKLLNDELDKYDEIAQAKLDAMNAGKEQDDYAKGLAQKQQEKRDIQSQLNAISMDDSVEAKSKRTQLQKDLADKQVELDQYVADRQFQLQQESIQGGMDARKKQVDEVDKSSTYVTGIMDKNGVMIQGTLNEIQSSFDSEKDYWTTYYSDMLDRDSYWAKMREDIMSGHSDKVIAMFQTMSDGITSNSDTIGSAITENILNNLQKSIDELTQINDSKILQSVANPTGTVPTVVPPENVENMTNPTDTSKTLSQIASPAPPKPATATAKPTDKIYRQLQYGSRGEDVKILQRHLGISADGIFGSQTRQAVRNYQSAHHLSVDGIAGKNTLTSMGLWATASSSSSSSGHVLTVGSKGEAVKTVQRWLGISADGIYGSQTKNAVIKYQKMRGIKADGIVGEQTLKQMGLWGKIAGFDTGGYTGDWTSLLGGDGKGGKLAFLHQKEMVLNKIDTANILKTVNVVRGIADLIPKLIVPQNVETSVSPTSITVSFNIEKVTGGEEGAKDLASKFTTILKKKGVKL